MPVIECDETEARKRLEDAGVTIESGNTDHECWRAEHEGATAVAYEGKVVVQGSDPERLLAVLSDHSGRAHVYSDGAARGNPGPAAIGWVIVTDDGIASEGGKRIGKTTNNRAEYEALIHALEIASEYGFETVEIRCDAELVVRQVQGEYQTNDPALRERRIRVRELLDQFEDYSITHVPREINERADQLANEAFENG